MSGPLLLLGASVRAVAQSAARAGFDPYGVDLFGDRDLRALAQSSGGWGNAPEATIWGVAPGNQAVPPRSARVRRYPAGLVPAALSFPPMPWVYTGALENYPRLVDALAQRRALWGNSGDVLRRVREPFRVAEALRMPGISPPEVIRSPEDLPRDGTWLRKPFRGGGGRNIALWDEQAGEIDPRTCYYQRRVAGRSCAAVYVAADGGAMLLGVTAQLVGTSWTGAAEFHYAGSIGPLDLSDTVRRGFEQMGERLAAEFGLMGLFGVDVVVAGEIIHPVEVNTRFPASVEVLERTLGFSAIGLHVEACRDARLPAPVRSPTVNYAGKAIVFARHDLQVPPALITWAEAQNQGPASPAVADIPEPESRILAGMPVLTVLAAGETPAAVEAELRRRVATVQGLLAGGTSHTDRCAVSSTG
ncbi:MAG: ATP-grasp domain-containing protein [Planctomycetia bacterium]|nr:ATP-grasp domain-containing protein [Planctomycetia bacterium]